MKKYFLLITLILLIAIASFSLIINNISRLIVIRGSDFHYVLQTGATAQNFVQDIQQYTGFPFPLAMKFFIRWKGVGKCLLAGEYLFPHDSTIGDVVDKVISGNVVYHPLTIIDGWRFHKVMKVLNNAPFIQHTLAGLSTKQIAKKLNLPFQSLEGLISPNTYYYTWGASDLEILKMAYQSMINYLAESWFNRDEDLPYQTPYQALIVASILEKEASLPTERRMISGIIVNRLRKHMRLQMDSTVIYALGYHFNGDLTKIDLHYPSSYNTYLHDGLPPTPIAMPNFDAIDAAMHPIKTNALYFVSKNNGTHIFSRTLKEQNAAVNEYQKKL